jgi:hypothetical protein
LRHVERDGKLSRGVIIINMRGSRHNRQFHEFTINDKGLNIGESFGHVPITRLGIPLFQGLSETTGDPDRPLPSPVLPQGGADARPRVSE